MTLDLSSWWVRVAGVALVWVALLSVSVLLGHEIQAWRALLLVALVAAVAALVMDTYSDPPASWREEADGREDWRAVDARTAFFVRLLQSHLTGRPGDPRVRDHLVRLARDAGASGDPADPELVRLAVEPPRRMSRQELAYWLDRIERM